MITKDLEHLIAEKCLISFQNLLLYWIDSGKGNYYQLNLTFLRFLTHLQNQPDNIYLLGG